MLALDLATAVGILLAWVGWGSLLNWTLVRDPATDWGQKAAWGVALLIGVGGALELTGAISRPLILTILAAGWVLWTIDVSRHRLRFGTGWKQLTASVRRNRLATAIAATACALVVLKVAAAASGHSVNIHDDQQAYLVFPARMLEAGHMGDDPFNHRRLVSALGGKSFLDTFTMSVGRPYNLHLTDAGLGLLLVLGLLLGRFRRRGVAALPAAGILLLGATVASPQVNMSAVMLGTALLFSLFRTLDNEWTGHRRAGADVILIALTAAAIAALKNQLLPPVAISLAFSYLIYVRGAKSRRGALSQAAVCAALTLLLLLPWMLSLLSSSGTLLYGVLGTGYGSYDLTADFRTPEKTLELVGAAVTNRDFLALVTLGALTLRRPEGMLGRGAALALASGSALAAIVVVVVTAAPGRTVGIAAHRYCFPFLMAAILALLTTAADRRRRGGFARAADDPAPASLRATAITATAALLCLSYVPQMATELTGAARAVRFAQEGGPRFSPDAVAALQRAVPRRQPLLARLEEPFLLDFDRNPILVVDHPGMVSPAPGMPVFEGSEALAEYLLELPIRYVAYSYRSEANYSELRFGQRLLPQTHPAIRLIARHVFDFNHSLRQLGRSRKRIFDDGDMFVLDLTQRTAAGADALQGD